MWTHRYIRMRDTIRSQLQWLGFSAHTEQEVPSLPHRPDVRASGFSIPTTHFEVYITYPNRLASALPRNSAAAVSPHQSSLRRRGKRG